MGNFPERRPYSSAMVPLAQFHQSTSFFCFDRPDHGSRAVSDPLRRVCRTIGGTGDRLTPGTRGAAFRRFTSWTRRMAQRAPDTAPHSGQRSCPPRRS